MQIRVWTPPSFCSANPFSWKSFQLLESLSFVFKGRARTQSPTNTNYAPEFPTLGGIAGFNSTEVQWKSLDLGELPCWSQCPLCQVSMMKAKIGPSGPNHSDSNSLSISTKEKWHFSSFLSTFQCFSSILWVKMNETIYYSFDLWHNSYKKASFHFLRAFLSFESYMQIRHLWHFETGSIMTTIFFFAWISWRGYPWK